MNIEGKVILSIETFSKIIEELKKISPIYNYDSYKGDSIKCPFCSKEAIITRKMNCIKNIKHEDDCLYNIIIKFNGKLDRLKDEKK